ncbi:SigE family RNA polymerase sigma factor [Actinacidiphila glaucinigra]|uniref:SigE family RNA polymerase sigma factor n=1 Tax=Actinacidiphila glaucinigra TaxID=235986 RepID=UPI0035D65119
MHEDRTKEYLHFAATRAAPLFRSACLLTGGDTHLAEDLVQETLGKMYVTWRRASRVGNPAGYAQTVLVRTFLTHRRRRSSGESPVGELPDVPTGSRESDSDTALLRLTLLDALARLAPKDRAVVVLRYWEDRSIEETADAMRVSSSAVRTRSVRALAKLRELLGDSLAELVSSH